MFIYTGCKAKIPIRDGPDDSFRVYLRYINNNAPPLIESYYLTSKGLILKFVHYDSDGDWISDKVIEFSENPETKTVSVRSLSKYPGIWRYSPQDKMKLKLSKRFHHGFESLFIEPTNLHPINKSRLASSEYQKAKNTVIKFKPLKNLKEKGQSPETFPGIYYSGSDNCTTPPTQRR